MKIDDGLLLGLGEPPVARDRTVMLVGLSEAVLPSGIRAPGDADGGHDLRGTDVGLAGPRVDVIDDLVSNFMGNPATG